jgi:hypothetical protein
MAMFPNERSGLVSKKDLPNGEACAGKRTAGKRLRQGVGLNRVSTAPPAFGQIHEHTDPAQAIVPREINDEKNAQRCGGIRGGVAY